MASGFFAVLDDIAFLMDDVAVATKVATRKTAGILGDDLAVNAEKATGFLSDRELPVLWSITKGSLLNKLIIVPIALLLNALFPAAIKFILILGGIYLAYEGAEKIFEFLFHRKHPKEADKAKEKADNNLAKEKEKVKSAVTTDFILSIEIVIIALGAVAEKDLTTQIVAVAIVAILATVGVYGIVALIVRTDDLGYKLIKGEAESSFSYKVGHVLVKALPVIIKVLSVVGVIALLLVSGGIFVHNIPYFHHLLEQLPLVVKEFSLGLIIGSIAVGIVTIVKKMFFKPKPSTDH
ncbi:DUF808 domain-containing protein [Mucilaginibacter sp. KACC 22063]|uniref:DUF808 domain-containing protein n=1 Tax=Mucilaginibacter sp. KACC 22063 TaxID=3025666 RepID=UPI002366F606|nr:DUF808 domain-containing protein [Mucilaginibacter sp. KACC 22063]WDF56169.1 DUF808 domain-containing protein [Mucilaginibacter sp. KACC 22063]